MADEILTRLAGLDSCAVSDALDRHGLPGTVHGISRRWPCPRTVGRVITVMLGEFDPEATTAAPHLGTRAIERAGEEDVIVVANAGRVEMAGWGGLLSLASRRRGVRGVVVDGAVRDVDEAESIGFSMYARAAVPTTARRRVVEVGTGDPVTIAGATVATGDLVIADASGVVFVDAGHAAEVVATAEELAAREAAMAAAIEAGRPPTEVLGASYERMAGG